MDIIVVFMSEYYDADMNLIQDHKKIASNYIKGWFLLDIFAIIPFELVILSL